MTCSRSVPGSAPPPACSPAVLARLTALELEERYCRRLQRELGDSATVIQGDATELPFPEDSFSGAVCFTMLHHVPSPELQDRLLAEVTRVLRPGGAFAGTDSLGHGLLFKTIHIGDTLVPVDPRRSARSSHARRPARCARGHEPPLAALSRTQALIDAAVPESDPRSRITRSSERERTRYDTAARHRRPLSLLRRSR